MREAAGVVSLKPWQFSIRRMLAATAGLAAVLGFFGPVAGYGSSVVWFLAAVIVGQHSCSPYGPDHRRRVSRFLPV